MKHLWLTFILVVMAAVVAAQQPCVAIETILVDACTLGSGCPSAAEPTCNCEGKNEMMTFRVGPIDLFVSDMIINWPNNPWLGVCQSAQSAANVAALNATIQSCGHLLEPVNSMLPAGSEVLVVTSADMCLDANPFTNLADTLIVLFQCPGNFAGHFANHGIGMRTTTITFGGACSSTVTYDRSLLVTQLGIPGPEDGAAVDFDLSGNPTYYNNGCQAPGPNALISAGSTANGCAGTPISLNGSVQGPLANIQWSGGLGSFANAASPVTTYTPSEEESGTVTLTLTAFDCVGPVSSNVTITVIPLPVATLITEDGTTLCEGTSLTIGLQGTVNGTWSTGTSGNSITVTEPGLYSVEVTNMCATVSASIEIIGSAAPDVTLNEEGPFVVCANEPVTISATSNAPLLWPDGSTGDTFTSTTAGTFQVTATNGCGTVGATFEIIEGGIAPDAGIVNLGSDELCPGETTTLIGSGEGDYIWSNGSTASEIQVGSGTWELVVSTACGSSAVMYIISALAGEPVQIDQGPSTAICADGQPVVLTATGDGDFVWDDGSTGALFVVDAVGTYTVMAVNECGTYSYSTVVTNSDVTALFVPSTASRSAPVEINFQNLSSGGAVAFEWYLDGQAVSEGFNYSRLFTWPDTYLITLIAEDAAGCRDSYSLPIEIILVDDQLFVPNAFTPDNDGINEVFKAYGPDFPDFKMEIYNRWGDLVFVSNDMRRGWNGDSKGSGYYAQNDVYVWVISYTSLKGRERLTGHVVVVR